MDQLPQNTRALLQCYRNGTKIPKRAGDYWSDEERESVAAYHQAGYGISDIAIMFGRTESGIINQLNLFGLLSAPNAKRTRFPQPPRNSCENCKYRKAFEENQMCGKEHCHVGELG